MSTKADKKVLLDKGTDGVGWITLDDDSTRNSLSNSLALDFIEILSQVESDDDINVITITGDGVAFCSGMNLHDLGRASEAGESTDTPGTEMRNRIRSCPKITIAVVNGYCLGAGISLVSDCDLAIASDKSSFGLPEIRRGGPPGRAMGELVTTIPLKYAADMIISGRNWDAQKALTAGFISRVVPHDQIYEAGYAWAKEIASFDKEALLYCKEGIRLLADQPTWTQRIRMNRFLIQEMRSKGHLGMFMGGAQAFFAKESGSKATT